MIEYVEIRDKDTREIIGIIDSANSVIWHSVYFGVGDFEIYVKASDKNLEMLKVDNYVTRPDCIEVGVIESINITNNAIDGLMIVASGRFAKSILDRRHIFNLAGSKNYPTILRGKVEEAVRNVVSNNAIQCPFDYRRNITSLELGALSGIPLIIVDGNGNATQKQVSYQNLLEYTDSVLEEYGMAALVILNDDTYKLQYVVYIGEDKSADNTAGNDPVIFGTEFDNLIESSYELDTSKKKTSALIGGAGEGLERFYSLIKGTEEDIERREIWVDGSSISRTYDEDGEEIPYTDAEYRAMLDALGKQELAELTKIEIFDGNLNVAGGAWRLNEDYSLGDIVTVQDNKIGKYANVRITEITEVQDENGYAVQIAYRN